MSGGAINEGNAFVTDTAGLPSLQPSSWRHAEGQDVFSKGANNGRLQRTLSGPLIGHAGSKTARIGHARWDRGRKLKIGKLVLKFLDGLKSAIIR